MSQIPSYSRERALLLAEERISQPSATSKPTPY